MSYCTKCGKSKSESEQFCTRCGTSFPRPASAETGSLDAVPPSEAATGAWPQSGQPAPATRSHSPAGGDAKPANQRRAAASRTRLLVAGIIVVVLAAGGGTTFWLTHRSPAKAVALESRSSSPFSPSATQPTPTASETPTPSPISANSSTPTARSEAQAISDLLTHSVSTRSGLQTAVDDAMTCTDLSYSVSELKQVASGRQAELNRAQTLITAMLPDGAVLKANLIKALRYSLNADHDYLSWAQQQTAHCQYGSQADATANNDEASTYKNQFVDQWNAIAGQYGLPSIDPNTI